MVKVSVLHGLGDDNIDAGYVNIDNRETLALYIMGSCIGVNNPLNSDFPWRLMNGVNGLKKLLTLKRGAYQDW